MKTQSISTPSSHERVCLHMGIVLLSFMISLAMLCCLPTYAVEGEDGSPANWTLKKVNGTTTLFHNDKPMLLNMVYSEDTRNAKYTTCLSHVFSREASVKAYQLPTEIDWTLQGIHEKELLERLSLLLDDSPDAYAMIRIMLWPPMAWAEKYPEQMVWNEKGRISYTEVPGKRAPFSILSEFYTDKAVEGVARIVNAVEKSKYASRVIGYMPCVGWSGESNAYRADDCIADHSPAAKDAFKKYLMNKYGTLEGINAILGSNFKSPDEIDVPAEKDFNSDEKSCFLFPNINRMAREYYRFSEEVFADNILKICHAVKKVNPGKLTGTFYGQIMPPGSVRSHLTYGRYCLEKLAASPDFDFIYALGFYGHAGMEHPLRLQALVDPMNLYGKAVIVGYDRPTHLLCYLPVIATPWYVGSEGLVPITMSDAEHNERQRIYRKSRGEDYGKNFRDFFVEKEKQGAPAFNFAPTTDRCPANMQETINNIRRYTAFCLTKPTIGILWWDQEGTRRNPFGGMAFNHPLLMQEIKKTGELFDSAVAMDRTSRAEVAVFYDNVSLFYRTPAKGRDYLNDAFVGSTLALAEAGVPFDEYFFDEIEKIANIKQYKILVFLNSNYVSTERRKWISENLKNDKRTLIWFFASGLINEKGMHAKNIKGLTGISVKEEVDPEMMACSISRFSKTPTPLGGIPEKYRAFGNLELSKLYTPWYSVSDPDAIVMGKSLVNHKPVFAMKEFPEWRSIVMPTGPIPVPVFREFMKLSGVHSYTEKEDVIVWAVKELIAVHTYRNHKGELSINIPPDVKACRDMYTGEVYPIDAGHVKLDVDGFTVKLLHLENR